MPPTRIGRWTFRPELHQLSDGAKHHRLEPKHARLLELLAANAGNVVTKETILAHVWKDVFVTEEVLTNSIYQLRRVLGDSARAPRYIETIPKRGYRLVATVSPAETETSRARLRLAIVMAALLLVSLLTIANAVKEQKDARGWSDLASERWELVATGEMSKQIGLPLVEQAAMRAIELDPKLSRPWIVRGQVHAARWEWRKAEHAMRHAIALDPDSEHAHTAYAELLLLTGRGDAALARVTTALALAPESQRVLHSAGFIHTMLRKRASAQDFYSRALEIDPSDEHARKNLEKLRSGRGPAAEVLTAERIDQLLRKQPLRPAIVAGMFAEAGELEKAFQWLRRAREEKDMSLLLVRLDDRWTRLHSDERFRSILNDVEF